MVITGLQTNFIHTADDAIDQWLAEQTPDYSNKAIYLDLDTNYDEQYPDDAQGFRLFVDKENDNESETPFTDYLHQKMVELSELDQNSDLHKKSQDDGFDVLNPFTFNNFNRAHSAIHNEIQNEQVAWLAYALQLGKNSADLANYKQLQFLKASPSTDLILDRLELPLLESIEKNNDLIVNLLLIHHANFNAIDWNKRFPVLAQGCQLLLHQNADHLIHAAVGNIDQSQLPESLYQTTIFQFLQAAVMNIEAQIVQALQNSIKSINSAIDDAIRDNSAINQAVMPAFSYLMQHEQVQFIHYPFEYYVRQIQERFMHTIRGNKIKTVESFIQTQMNLNFTNNNGWNPLIFAAFNNYPEIVRLLLAASADVNVKDDSGSITLMFAAFNNYLEIVRLLLAAGAHINIKNNDGKTALDLAHEKLENSNSNEEDRVKAQQIIDLLVDAGAKLAE